MGAAPWALRRLWHWLSLWFICQAEHKFDILIIMGKGGLLVAYHCRFCSLGGMVGPLVEADVPKVVQTLVG